MEGLLDFLKTPEGQGLLGATFAGLAGARRNQPWNTAGAAGLGGLLAYNQGVGNQTNQALKDMQIAEAKRKQDAINALPEADRSAVMAGVPYADIWKNRNPEAKYVDGFDDQGRPVKGWATPQGFTQVGGSQSKPANWQDRGGELVPLDPYTGMPITGVGPVKKTMSAAERDASARGWAGIGLQRENQNRPQYNADAGGFVVAPTEKNPNGGFIPLPGGNGMKPMTEAQGKAAGFADRMIEAERIMSDPKLAGAQKPEVLASVLESIPLIGGVSGRSAQSSARDQVRQAQENWVRANLRKESGAVIGEQEMAAEVKNYFPQIGDGADVIKQKAQFRRTVANSMAREAGRGYKPPSGNNALFSEADAILNGGR